MARLDPPPPRVDGAGRPDVRKAPIDWAWFDTSSPEEGEGEGTQPSDDGTLDSARAKTAREFGAELLGARRGAPDPLAGFEDFELLGMLGRGAFATVFVARQRSMERLVALKVSERTGREPQTMARLEHPNIVRVYDQREVPQRGARLLYMEYVQGGSLADAIERVAQTPSSQRGPHSVFSSLDERAEISGDPLARRRSFCGFDWEETVAEIGAQLADALGHAHERGVLHLDVKPANVLLDPSGRPKLVDFNISACEGMSDAGRQPFGGSMGYMAPEHLAAFMSRRSDDIGDLDGRADVYSLAATLWELLHAERPFGEPSASGPDVRLECRRSWPDAWDREQGPAATELERVLRRALSFDRQDRFSTGREFAAALRTSVNRRLESLLSPPRGIGRISLRHPVATGLLFGVVPHILAAIFNFAYNREEIIAQVQGSFDGFMRVQTVINLVGFGVGLTLFGLRLSSMRAVWKRCSHDPPPGRPPADRFVRVRERLLWLGYDAALLGVGLWVVAGLAYPLSLHVIVGTFPAQGYLHFGLSLLFCGAIASAYPALFQQLAAIRLYYPMTLEGDVTRIDRPALDAFAQRSGIYLMMAGGVPMAALTLLVMYGSQSAWALAVLGAAGLCGFAGAFALYRRIQRHVGTLVEARLG